MFIYYKYIGIIFKERNVEWFGFVLFREFNLLIRNLEFILKYILYDKKNRVDYSFLKG